MCSVSLCSSLLVTGQVQQEAPGEPSAPCCPQLLGALLSLQAEHIVTSLGVTDNELLLPSIWAWDAKLWLKHLKAQGGAAAGSEGGNSVGIPRAAEAVFIHTHVQVSQDKKVKFAPLQYQKNVCAVRCPQEPLHIWHLGMVGTSNGYGHLSSIYQPKSKYFIVVGKRIVQREIATLAIYYKNQPKGEFLPKSLFPVPYSPAELQKQQTLKSCRQLSSLKLL